MKEQTIKMLSDYIDQLIGYAMQGSGCDYKSLNADAVEKIINSLPIEDRKTIDDFIMRCISSNHDLIGEMYKSGFKDCIKVLKVANKI